jgi:nucleoside-diphosphate-sugar epimerase
MQKIAILGCGWLGFPLAEILIKNGFSVNGSTTQASKLENLYLAGIKPFLLNFTPELNGNHAFFEVETLIINIPPKAKTKGETYHLIQIEAIINAIKITSEVKNIVFVSSTSVYNNTNQTVFETDANTNHFLVIAEKLLKNYTETNNINLTILRMGGLMGFDRNPCNYINGKNTNLNTPVNYVHRHDAVFSILEVLKNNIYNEIFNIVSQKHPTRGQIFEKCNADFKKENPDFNDVPPLNSYKIVNNDKFIKISQYIFKYPDPLNFSYL